MILCQFNLIMKRLARVLYVFISFSSLLILTCSTNVLACRGIKILKIKMCLLWRVEVRSIRIKCHKVTCVLITAQLFGFLTCHSPAPSQSVVWSYEIFIDCGLDIGNHTHCSFLPRMCFIFSAGCSVSIHWSYSSFEPHLSVSRDP